MYPVLHRILSDRPDGVLFRCFGLWHIAYMILFLCMGIFVLSSLKGKRDREQRKAADLFINMAFGLYLADFFLMPLAYGEIDIEKLPFHICTAMCVLSFLSRRVTRLRKYTVTFASLGLLSNLGYLIYPAGVMWHQTHPFSYRVMETLCFHGLMSVYGAVVLAYEPKGNASRAWRRDLLVIACMVLWALLGNSCYNGDYNGSTHFFNWFFVVRDPFYILPEAIAKYIMPPINVLLFFFAQRILYGIVSLTKNDP